MATVAWVTALYITHCSQPIKSITDDVICAIFNIMTSTNYKDNYLHTYLLVFPTASISSIYIMQGACFRA